MLALVIVAAATNMPAAAWAQQRPPPSKQKLDEALTHFKGGVDLYEENDFAGALVEFKRAYDMSQDYHVLFNMAQTYYQLQNYAAALGTFERYLDAGGAAIDKKRHAYVEGEMQRLHGRVAQVRVTVNVAHADILVDDEKVGTSPLEQPITVSQGKRKITALVAGKPPVIKTLEVAGGDSVDVTLQIQSESTPVPPPPPVIVETRRRIPWIAWGVAGGLFVVWGATGVTALVFSGVAQGKLNTYGATASEISTAQSDAKAFALVSDISLGCTVVAVSVAFVMTLLTKPEPVDKEKEKEREHTTSHGISAKLFVAPTGFAVFGSF
jgi:tetratricopeptide (TPR) repeat protein